MTFELSILDFIQECIRCKFLDSIMPVITMLGNGGWFWIVCTIITVAIPKTRKLGLAMMVSLLAELLLCSLCLKPLVARTRPFDVNTGITLLVSKPKDFSFPSGHSCAAFAIVATLFFRKNKWWIPTAVLASLIAFSRLYLYVHYPTDVLAGIILGILCGFIGNFVLRSFDKQ